MQRSRAKAGSRVPIAMMVAVLMMILAIGCGVEPTSVPQTSGQEGVNVQPTSMPAQNQAPGNAGQVSQQIANRPVIKAPDDIEATDKVNNIEYLSAQPMGEVVSAQRLDVQNTDCVNVPFITWGADLATIYANGGWTTQPGSIMDQKGLCVNLFRMDNFKIAVERFIGGQTPFLRCVTGMCVGAGEVMADKGITLVSTLQHSWSGGGDTMVCRSDMVNKLSDIAGKRIAVQRYGPQVDLIPFMLNFAGVSTNDVEIVYTRELTRSYDVPGDVAVNPMDAMFRDKDLACVMVISPDMSVLTANDTIGKGGESVKNAKKMFSTRGAASRFVADQYFTSDAFYATNREWLEKFTHAVLMGQEEVADLFNSKQQRSKEYSEFTTMAADMLLDNPLAVDGVEGLYGDMEFAGFRGNVEFYTSENEFARTFEVIKGESEEALTALGFISGPVQFEKAVWDWNKMAVGLRNTKGVEIPKLNAEQLASVVEARHKEALADLRAGGSGDVEGYLFGFSVKFEQNQKTFSISGYQDDIIKAVDFLIKNPFAGASIVGHSDPLKHHIAVHGIKDSSGSYARFDIVELEADPEERYKALIAYLEEHGTKNNDGTYSALPLAEEDVQAIWNSADLLAKGRAESLRQMIIEFSEAAGAKVDGSRITVISMGVDRPLYLPPMTPKEWAANRRVDFEVHDVEGEVEQFIFIGEQ